ncbi:conserved hypothetical protein [Oleispira antarctica RB-8]|uniref:DUF4824 family protein n=1 Tax=Oleispira antarctica RB-8 TaxID=698738 RepID=R4YKL7_OLEAN|nr:conserved hypothetical protein [Oleispira antarctica RB-8]
MKHLPGSKTLFILALSLVLLVNAFILIGVWYNRSGLAESVVVLTERELHMPYRWNRDQTSVRIDWRAISSDGDSYSGYSSPAWFDENKLVSLGFEFSDDSATDYKKHFIEAEAVLVLEYDGETYQQAVKHAQKRVLDIEKKLSRLVDDEDLLSDLKRAKENLKHEEQSASRLFVIDAGLDKEVLRIQYPDNQRYILAYGIVDVRSTGSYRNNTKPTFSGRIDRLSVQYLYIDNSVYSNIDKLKPSLQYSRNENSPRFSLAVHYGQKLEPWIDSSSFALLNNSISR